MYNNLNVSRRLVSRRLAGSRTEERKNRAQGFLPAGAYGFPEQNAASAAEREDIMKKLALLLLVFTMAFGTGCGSKEDEDKKSEGVMTWEEYNAAAVDSKVTIEAYVQAKQAWWEDKATVYLQDKDGAYFVYEMACSESDYEKLTKGTKIKVTGSKAEWSGEVEIIDATFEIGKGSYIAEAKDVTSLLADEAELIKHQNEFVAFKGMTVEAQKDEDGNEVAYLYKWNGSGQEGDDLYFNVSVDGKTYTFTVESYLCDKDTDVYKAVKELKIGDKIDMEGFLYWYEGVNPHITSVTAAK